MWAIIVGHFNWSNPLNLQAIISTHKKMLRGAWHQIWKISMPKHRKNQSSNLYSMAIALSLWLICVFKICLNFRIFPPIFRVLILKQFSSPILPYQYRLIFIIFFSHLCSFSFKAKIVEYNQSILFYISIFLMTRDFLKKKKVSKMDWIVWLRLSFVLTFSNQPYVVCCMMILHFFVGK